MTNKDALGVVLPDTSDWDGMTRDQARSLTIGVATAARLVRMNYREIANLVPAWKELVDKMRKCSNGYKPLDDWDEILDKTPEDIVRVAAAMMVDPSPYAIEMRKGCPMCYVLPDDERQAIYPVFRKAWTDYETSLRND